MAKRRLVAWVAKADLDRATTGGQLNLTTGIAWWQCVSAEVCRRVAAWRELRGEGAQPIRVTFHLEW